MCDVFVEAGSTTDDVCSDDSQLTVNILGMH
jgi:hypothetical protein